MIDLLLTEAGRTAIVNAQIHGTGAVNITACQVGSAQYKPDAGQTELKASIKQMPAIAGAITDPTVLHLTTQDTSDDAYSVGEIGFFLEDGTLFAVGSSPGEVIADKAAASQLLISYDVVIIDAGNLAELITVTGDGFLNPQATESTQGIARIATGEEAIAGRDDEAFITSKKLATASWKINAKLIGNMSVSTDMNTIIVSGFYKSQTDGALWTNLPDGYAYGAFTLTVTSIGGSRARQALENYSGAAQYVRTCDNGGAWTPWELIALESDSWKINAKEVGNTSTSTNLNDIIYPGFYRSAQAVNKWTNLPAGKDNNGAFTLTVNLVSAGYPRQTLEDYLNQRQWVRARSSLGVWTPWESVVTGSVVDGVLKLNG